MCRGQNRWHDRYKATKLDQTLKYAVLTSTRSNTDVQLYNNNPLIIKLNMYVWACRSQDGKVKGLVNPFKLRGRGLALCNYQLELQQYLEEFDLQLTTMIVSQMPSSIIFCLSGPSCGWLMSKLAVVLYDSLSDNGCYFMSTQSLIIMFESHHILTGCQSGLLSAGKDPKVSREKRHFLYECASWKGDPGSALGTLGGAVVSMHLEGVNAAKERFTLVSEVLVLSWHF